MTKKITKNSVLTFVELPPTQFGVLNGDSGYDIYSHINMPSRAIATLRGVLIGEGYTNTYEINPKYHGRGGKLTHENMQSIFQSDVLLLSSITRTAKQTMSLADLYKLHNPQGIVVAGGPDPTFRTEDWLDHVDVVIRVEGEATLKDLMQGLSEDASHLEEIKGIYYIKNGEQKVNMSRPLLSEEELGKMPHPFYDKIVSRQLKTGTIETTRGCPHDCDYCGVTSMYGNAYRRRPIRWTLEEMANINGFGIKTFIVDDNISPGGPKDIERLEAIEAMGEKGNKRVAQITVYARSEERRVGK